MAALHTLLRLYEPDDELAALGRPKENYRTTTQCPAWQASKHCPGASALSAAEVAVVHQLFRNKMRLRGNCQRKPLPPLAQRVPLPR